ncbi:hypothetical protein ABZX93_05995 [Streptomyces sp. NPDC006632]|uniref:hypothetical protein n=1 Tax=Streptomyces sp. NPDC006632 TaxID=3157182 RepID=UPI0033A850B9
MREVIIKTLEMEGRNPSGYNIAGIARDAFYSRGSFSGFGAHDEATWRKAVEQHKKRHAVGDMVRVVLEVDGLTEHHYGRIAHFRKANGGGYRGTPVKPHSAYVELVEHGARTVPLAEVTRAEDDFEIFTDYSDVHRGAMNGDGYFRCRDCGGNTYKGAQVKVVHKASGQCVRLCNGCDDIDRRVRLGHSVMWDGRTSRTTIFELRENPALITGPVDDYEADMYRQWADVLPYLVPAEAAELYKKWRQERHMISV